MAESTWQRARGADRKAARRRDILSAAEALLAERSVAEIAMADIAGPAGVSKATLYLYFATKEALFLALTETVLERWLSRVREALRETGDVSEVRRGVAAAFEAEPALAPLLGVLHTTLEHNIDDAEVRRFKHFLKDAVTDLGGRLDSMLGWPPGSGVRVLLRLHVAVIGSIHLASPSPPVQRVLHEDRALALFRLDFPTLLEDLLPLVFRRPDKENDS